MPYLLLTLAAMFWGGNYVVGHILVTHADPLWLTEARWALTALLLVGLYHRQIVENRLKIRQSWPVIGFLSLFGQVLFPLTLYIGLQSTSSLNAAIYLSATPAMVLVINKAVFGEAIGRNNILGVVFSSVGVLYLILKGDVTHFDAFRNMNRGDLWTMGSAFSWAIYCSFLRKKDKTLAGNAFVAVCSVIGALILLPITALAWVIHPVMDFGAYANGGFMLGLGYLVIFPSWLSYLFWNRGIADIGATRGEIYTHLIPLSGGLFSILFLQMRVGWFHLVSALFILAGIYLCSKKVVTKC